MNKNTGRTFVNKERFLTNLFTGLYWVIFTYTILCLTPMNFCYCLHSVNNLSLKGSYFDFKLRQECKLNFSWEGSILHLFFPFSDPRKRTHGLVDSKEVLTGCEVFPSSFDASVIFQEADVAMLCLIRIRETRIERSRLQFDLNTNFWSYMHELFW